MPRQIRIQDLYDSLRERLGLVWLAGLEGHERAIPLQTDRSDTLLVGPLNFINPNRIQVIGQHELSYFDCLDDHERAMSLQKLFDYEPTAVMVVNGVEAPADLIDWAERTETPLLSSPLDDRQVLDNLQYYGSLFLSDKTTLHGVFLEVLGMGVLLTGDSAVGKSELALELISRGNRLIADDAPEFSRIAPDIISGTCPKMLREFIEVRGLGILNVRAMFGDSAIKRTKYLRLIVHLERMTDEEIAAMDRLKGSHTTRTVLGLEIPEVRVPVAPGRNMAILVESAVRNHMLKLKGYNAPDSLIARQKQAIHESK